MTHIHLDLKPEDLCDALFMWHEALRRLGVTADEIFVAPNIQDIESGILCWGVTVRIQELEWSASVGTTTETVLAFTARWDRFVRTEVPVVEQTILRTLWNKWMPVDLFQEVAASMRIKGLPLRSLES